MKSKYLIVLILLFSATVFAQHASQSFISLKNTGVEEFRNSHPDYDGRGTIVLVFDTGVDMGIEGLIKTSTGETKMIDVQDFTGQGDVKLYEADIDDEDDIYYFENEDMNYKVNGADKLSLKAKDGNYYIGQICESLWKNSSSGAEDVNGNETKDDKFTIVCFLTEKDGEEFWVAYFDTNSNGDLADEKPLRNYKEKFDSFQIPNEKGLPNFTMGLNIFPDEMRVSFHFDDGAHGTHCAGIATGNEIGDNAFNGVAPGANLMSLKLGNNNFAGGSTVTESMKKAFLYADKVSKEREEPCIINMSFGIGSEIEGRADMELFIDELVKNNPYLYISTSNGNEGPGLSTTGLPAASSSLFSSGAVLAQEVGQDLYGAPLNRDIILHFSSRGAEVSKPDVVSPGAATSTVPNWTGGDRFWGTSMASPYSAGVMSLLLGAMKVEFPDVKIPSLFLYKVLRESAVYQKDYNHVDQGGGLINVVNAYNLLKKYIKAGEIDKFETYTISSFSATMPNSTAPNLYIRNGSYLTGNETFTFSINRKNIDNKKKFYRIFKLVSDSDWLMPIQHSTYLRNNHGTNVNVKLDKSKMTEPGMYNGKIYAYRNDKSKNPEFELMATVIIPIEFNSSNNYSTKIEFENLEPGMHKRYFLNIPPGTSTTKITMSAKENDYALAWYFLHAPDGQQLGLNFINSDTEANDSEKMYYNLEPGVYELDVLGYYRAKANSTFSLKVEFDGFNRIGNSDISSSNNEIVMFSEFSKVKRLALSGEILGYEKSFTVKFEKNDVIQIPFELKPEEALRSYEIEISREDFNKVTDFALQIFDADGKAVSKDGLSYNTGSTMVRNRGKEEPVKYLFELRPAFANEPSTITVNVKEKTEFKSGNSFTVKNRGNKNVTFYPSVREVFNIEFEKPEFEIPTDSKLFGTIYFKSNGNTEYELPVNFKL